MTRKRCKQEGAIALLIWVLSTDGLYTYYVQPPERAQLLCKGGREAKGGSDRGLVLLLDEREPKYGFWLSQVQR